MTDLAAEALARWGASDASLSFVSGRENLVYRVATRDGDFALRIRRRGLRSRAELVSELAWLDAMDRAGLSVPRPVPSLSGSLLETVGGREADMTVWLRGSPLGRSGEPLRLRDAPQAFYRLGREIALLHHACDEFRPPDGFVRSRWGLDGLLGEEPLWGRFWENPTLDKETRGLLERFRREASRELELRADGLDCGLIHADLVRENVLFDGDRPRLIDFDDGGFGFRLFDIAGALLKNRKEPGYPKLESSLIEGYRTARPLDVSLLGLFMALRAVTYVGWIVPRMSEDGSPERNARFIDDARDLCAAYLGESLPD